MQQNLLQRKRRRTKQVRPTNVVFFYTERLHSSWEQQRPYCQHCTAISGPTLYSLSEATMSGFGSASSKDRGRLCMLGSLLGSQECACVAL